LTAASRHTLPFAVPEAKIPTRAGVFDVLMVVPELGRPEGPGGAPPGQPGARTASTPSAAAITAAPEVMSVNRRARAARAVRPACLLSTS
jgi:hypothetical protein